MQHHFKMLFLNSKVADQLELIDNSNSYQTLYLVGPNLTVEPDKELDNPLRKMFPELNLERVSQFDYMGSSLFYIPCSAGELSACHLVISNQIREEFLQKLEQYSGN